MMEKMVCDSEESGISNAQAFLSSAIALPISNFQTKDVIFSQGEPGGGVMYIQKGHVKLSVVSRSGKEAVVAILEPGDFLGDGALAGKNTRTATATAATVDRLPRLVIRLNFRFSRRSQRSAMSTSACG